MTKTKTIPILIGTLAVLISASLVALHQGEVIEPQDITEIEFEAENIAFTKENIQIATSTDEFGNTIQTGIKIPIKYNFPVATSTGYIIELKEEFVEMNFDGFNDCRQKGKTKNQCLQELRDDIEQTLQARQKNIARQLKELKRQVFQDEISIDDF